MKFRTLGKTGYSVSEVSLGTWQLGGKWGTPFDPKDARDTLEEAYDRGVNFFDTADGYQDGQSEKAVGEFVRNHPDVHYTTKIGRKEMPLDIKHFDPTHLDRYVDESLQNMGVDSLDMVLLHCPPMMNYYMPETFLNWTSASKLEKFRTTVSVSSGSKKASKPSVMTSRLSRSSSTCFAFVLPISSLA